MRRSRAFTIIELLVVVSIIGLLVGLLLPAIGKSQGQARLMQSKSNLRQLAIANGAYASEWQDRQFTQTAHDLSAYGDNYQDAIVNYTQETGDEHPFCILGYRESFVWVFLASSPGNADVFQPINFDTGFGFFRMPNVRSFNQYLNGRFYDPVYYAPKDRMVLSAVEPFFDDPGEYVNSSVTGGFYWSSYCWSPAALLAPTILANPDLGGGVDPWEVPGAFRAPTLGQARFPALKTHMLEHHWLQQARKGCNPFFTGGTYDDCEPFYFNHSVESAPATLFYDGHVASISQREVVAANQRHIAQTGWALWNNSEELMGGVYVDLLGNPASCTGGYFMAQTGDWTCHSAHILTTDGILGRDVSAE